MTSQRVLHFTFHKCGSQWVRDLLAAPEVCQITGFKLDGRSPRLDNDPWPEQAPGTLLAPIYNADAREWTRRADPDMKAIAVLRDPRDRLISWVFSFGYSHVRKSSSGLLQHLIPSLTRRSQILLGMYEFTRVAPRFASWSETALPRTLVTKYEALVADPRGEFRRMLDFLEWRVPEDVSRGVVERLSFQTRSGRAPGEVDIYSHYRKGVAGDWRNYFDRQLGQLFEERFPTLLVNAGYEKESSWFDGLPAELPALQEEHPGDSCAEVAGLRAELARVREERDELVREGKAPPSASQVVRAAEGFGTRLKRAFSGSQS